MYRVLEPYTLSTRHTISDAIWDENDDVSMEERLISKLLRCLYQPIIRNPIIKNSCNFMDSHGISRPIKYYQYYTQSSNLN